VGDYGKSIFVREDNEESDTKRALYQTLLQLSSVELRRQRVQMAKGNVERWAAARQAKKGQPTLVVSCHDWGDATRALTERFGVTFAVLNMANARSFGGGYEEGMMAQEENMFARSSCHFFDVSLTNQVTCHSRGRYTREMHDLLSATEGRVYLDSQNPRVCVTGSKQNGYRTLADDSVFPFYELRAAAVDMRGSSPTSFDEGELSKRIVAQLDTCREQGVRHVVLSAFGCGAFQNPPEIVAPAYRKALVGREADFDVVAFAIFYAGYGPATNYDTFAEVFGEKDVMEGWSVEFKKV
jgi:hypothetical protein